MTNNYYYAHDVKTGENFIVTALNIDAARRIASFYFPAAIVKHETTPYFAETCGLDTYD